MRAVFAQAEKKALVRKLRKSREAMRKAGKRCEGRKPFGTRDGERDTIDRIFELRRKRPDGKAMSFYAIAAELNAAKLSTRTGKPWSPVTVASIFRRGRSALA